jgi:hypothetical protein
VFAGGVKCTINVPFPEVLEVMVGALGVVAGSADAASDASEAPIPFTVRTRTLYVVPFDSPEIVSGRWVLAGLRVTQVSPLSMEYSMLEIGLPPLPPKAIARCTAPSAESTSVI